MINLRPILLLLFLGSPLAAQDALISTIAGGGTDIGDNVSATDLLLKRALDLTVDIDGFLYVADTDNHVVRRIDPLTGIATIVAGRAGEEGFSGDGGPATDAQLSRPGAVSVTDAGTLYIGDTGNRRVRCVDPSTGTIATVAGTGERGRFPDFVNSIPTGEVEFGEIVSLLAGSTTIFVGDGLDADGNGNNQILQILLDQDSTQVIAGTGRPDYSGEGGIPTDAGMTVEGMAADFTSGFSLLFADFNAHRIRVIGTVDSATAITTVAGRGPAGIFGEGGFFGDGGPATDAQMNFPTGVAVSPDGRIYIADFANSRVRAVDFDGNMVTIAGNGSFGNGGDGDLALRASLRIPIRVAIDLDGNLLILDSDRDSSVIRRVTNPDLRFPLYESDRNKVNFAPTSLGFGASLSLLIANGGNAILDLTAFEFDNPLFSVEEELPISIGPNLQRAVAIRFDPIGEDPVSGNLTIRTNDPFQPVLILPLSGSGIVPDIDVLPAQLAFDPTFTGETRQRRLRISNLTQGQLFIEGITLSDTTNFSFTPLSQNFVASGSWEDINVRFHPTDSGSFTSELAILSNDPDEPEFIIPLSATGILSKTGGFVDLANSLGVADPGASFGVAWSDYDADGDPDIYVAKSLQPNRLYRNDGAAFTDVAPLLGVDDAGDGSGAAWADYDGDGDLDLYVTNFGQPNRLYRNEGNSFSEVGALAGVDDTGDGFGAAWADTDRDGDPDLYVANFGSNVFYRNLGNGTFEEIADQLGIADSSSGIQPVFADFDNGRDPDLFVANSGPNRLWWNNGDGTFEDSGSFAFVPQDNGASTGAAVGDFNNDGYLDLYVPYFGTNRLYQNQGGEGFMDVALALGVGDTGNGRGAVWGDFDNDGFLDLFITNRDSKNRMFRNVDGNSQFTEVGESFGVATVADSRGVALADFDGDGGMDLFVAIQNDPDQLFHNQEAEGNWLTVSPIGTTSSMDAIGTRIEIIYNRIQRAIREITGGTSFLSQDALSASFGIGEAETVDTLNIRWPSGVYQRLSREDIGVNHVLTIVEEDPLPPVDIRVATTTNVLVANGIAFTDIAVSLLDLEGNISLVSDRDISFMLDVGGGQLSSPGGRIADGFASSQFTAGILPGTVSISIVVTGLPTERLLIELIPPLEPSDTFIERIAGSGSSGFSGDGGLATEAVLNTPRAVTPDDAGNVYIADTANNRIRVISGADSTITTIAGSGATGFGNIFEEPAVDADIGDPRGIIWLPNGDLIVSESNGQRVRRIDLAAGITTGFAGTGFAGFSGDGGPATEANLTGPRGLAADASGRTFLIDYFNEAVRLIDNGIISTIAGDPLDFYSFRDGVPATESSLANPSGVAVDGDGNVYIAESSGHRIRKVDTTGLISTFAGDGAAGSTGDGGPAGLARLNAPQDVVYGPSGRLYVSDSGNHKIRVIDLSSGVIQTVAGSGQRGSTGNQGDALSFSLNEPGGLAVAPDGSVLIADAQNDRVLRLTVQFQDATVPTEPPPVDPGGGGTGTADFNGDGSVDFLDFLPFAEAFGTSNPAFDLDGNGMVGFSDFLNFSNAFGRPISSNPAYRSHPTGVRR